jgi:hypothetical protein
MSGTSPSALTTQALPREWRARSDGLGGLLGVGVALVVALPFAPLGAVMLLTAARDPWAFDSLWLVPGGAAACALALASVWMIRELVYPIEWRVQLDRTTLRYHVVPVGRNAEARRSAALRKARLVQVELDMSEVREIRQRKQVELVCQDGSTHKLPKEVFFRGNEAELVALVRAHFPHVVVNTAVYPRVRYWRDRRRD